MTDIVLENKFFSSQSTFSKKQLKALFSDYEIKKLLKSGKIERLDHGIYNKADSFSDIFKANQLKYQKGIYCLNTSLYLWGFSDRYPEKLDMMFPRGYNPSNLSSEIIPHTQVQSLFNDGITTTQTLDGNEVKLYTLERTLAEILRPQNHIDPEIIISAYKSWAKQDNKDLNQLVKFAQRFKTLPQVQTYLEVLL